MNMKKNSNSVDAQSVRAANLKAAREAGFLVADSLPLRSPGGAVRPHEEIVKRLAAIESLCIYVSAPPDEYPEATVRGMIADHGLSDYFTQEEAKIMALTRDDAFEANKETIGWKMENMVPLCWALGNDVPPRIDGEMIGGPELDHIITSFAPYTSAACAALLNAKALRPAAEIIAMEDLFYCAHNAVRTAQFNDSNAVPRDFDPIVNGGVIHERRHALTWLISPGVAWDRTDLST